MCRPPDHGAADSCPQPHFRSGEGFIIVFKHGMRTALVLVAGWFLLTACGGDVQLDSHAKAACEAVAKVDAGGDSGSALDDMFGGAVQELVAIGEAEESSIEDLRDAAKTVSDDPDDNNGDVAFNAVADWCDEHA